MALTADIPTTRWGTPGNAHQPTNLPLAAAAKVYGGSVATSYRGYLIAPSTPSSDMVCHGIIQRLADNSAGNAGDVRAEVETGSFFLFAPSSGADALTEANVGQTVYLIDEKTVGATNGSSTRPQAGTLRFIDSTRFGDQFAVSIGTPAPGTGVGP